MEDGANWLAEIRGLTVKYVAKGTSPVVALDNVNLSIRPGEIVGVTGESGSGKSTLASAILRLLPPSAVGCGSIRFGRQELLKMGERELSTVRGAQISLVPQDPAVCLNPVIKVGEQIAEVLRAHMTMTGGQRKNHALGLLREVGFDDPKEIYTLYPHQLSGGQRQRVVIAQAMACRPKLVVADEPTSKLDASAQAHILKLLTNLGRQHGTAMLLITHDPTILTALADRMTVMYAGRIVEEGKTEDVCKNPLHPYSQRLLRLAIDDYRRSTTPRTAFPVIDGEVPSLTRTEPGCRFECRCKIKMPVCASTDPQPYEESNFHRVSCFLYGQ